MSQAPGSQSHEQDILLEQIKTLYQSMGSLLAINLLVSGCLVYGFWDVVAHQNLIIWMSMMLVMIAVRGVIYWHFRRGFDATRLTLYRRFLVFGSASAGLIWGAGGILLFVEGNFEYQLFLLMALYSMAGGSTFSLSLYLPAYFAYVPATLLPIAVKFLLLGGASYTSLGVVTFVYLAALTSFNLRLNRNFSESLKLRFENLDLIEQLTSQKLEAERANLAKSKFLAAASHDLRQPLYSLGLFATVLDELVNDDKAHKVLGQMRQSLSALENLFNKLLDISKLDAGVISAAKSDCSLNALFATLATEFDGVAAEKGLAIRWPTDPVAAHTDPVLLEQILRNLIANSIRYSDTGRIDVRSSTAGEQITVTVADSGIGIPPHALADIFTEFYQVDNGERDREKGLGLGLSIVKRCAALLGHTVAVASEEGEGTTFSVTLDRARKTERELASNQTHASNDRSHKFTRNTLVIIIDDEASIREGTKQLLEIWGCAVAAAEDLDSGLALLEQLGRGPTAIVSDFRLPDGQTGLQAVRAIQAQYGQSIPALLITGDIEQERLLEMNASDVAVLFKPVPPLKLRQFLEGAQRQHQRPQDSVEA